MRRSFSRLGNERTVSCDNSIRRTELFCKLFIELEKVELFLEMLSICFLRKTTVTSHCKKIDPTRQRDKESENMDQGASSDSLESLCTI
jgi:hypothetical protein